MNQTIECVPNFSEGRDTEKIKQITDIIESVSGIQLLNVDPGKATNRTVVTFVGEPEAVIEAAFKAIKKAAEIIDMRHQTGAHPRFGSTDVCPLVPVSNITMKEVVEYALKLAERVGDELGIPVYCYESAALNVERKSLAYCRTGQYEALEKRISDKRWKPDFGSYKWNDNVARSGAVAIGARNYLIAYNINLNTQSTSLANEIAAEVRESGKIATVEKSILKRIPGTLMKVRAIGWFIEEYGIAQISMNLTDIAVTPIHIAYEEVCKRAEKYKLEVTGSELVGLIPLNAILDAGKYFLKKQNLDTEIANEEIIKVAVKSLGLDELRPFEPRKKIIEYLIEDRTK